MVPGVRPVIVAVKLPVPVPFDVFEPAMVGFWVVLQQTPLSVTFAPPLLIMLPPLVNDVEVTDVEFDVEMTGTEAGVVIVIWLPYAVPTLFVAYALM